MKRLISILAVIILIAACKKNSTPDPGPTPITPVTIGTQVWMLKNLDVSTYKNGDLIPKVTDRGDWYRLTTGAWCYYNNDVTTNATYGKLYNWYAVNDPRGLAPAGWHIPSDAEWTTLSTSLGGDMVAGGKMKETETTHWLTPNTGATNSSGFTALPGGFRYDYGVFIGMGYGGQWWSSTESPPSSARSRYLSYDSDHIINGGYRKEWGFFVRCLRD